MESPAPRNKDSFKSESENEQDENHDTFNDSLSNIIKISDSATKKETMGNSAKVVDSVVSKLPRHMIRFESMASNDPKKREQVLKRMQ